MVEVYRAGERESKSKEWWKELVDGVLEKVGEEPRKAMLGAFCVRPNQKFMTQQEDEEIVLLLRAHPITNVGWMLLVVLMLILPGILLGTGMFAAVPGKFMLVGKLVWYLAALVYAFERFLYWYYSVFIVTNERIVDVDFENILWRLVTYANLNQVQESAKVTGGFIRSLLRFGDVYVTTASEKPSVEALGVPYPDKVVDIISRLSEELTKRRERGE